MITPHTNLPRRKAMEQFDREYIEAQLERNFQNTTMTANAMRIERKSLLRRMKQLGITKKKRQQEPENGP